MAPVGNRNPIYVQYLDHSGERRSFAGFSGAISLATIAAFLAQFGDLQTALDSVTLGNRSEQAWGEKSVLTNTRPASALAQIETEILIAGYGATTQIPWSSRVPTVDYAAFNWLDDKAILAGAGATAATIALVDAIETLMKEPITGEAIVVTSITVVE